MSIDVPERFFQHFESHYPAEETLKDPAGSPWLFASAGISNLVEYGTHTAAKRIEAIGLPVNLEFGTGQLFANASEYLGQLATMSAQEPNVPDIIDIGVDSMTMVMDLAGQFDGIPIVAAIVNFIANTTSQIITAYGQTQREVVEAEFMGYSRESDNDYVRQAATLYGASDLTTLFTPNNDASDGVDDLNQEVEQGWHGELSEVTKLMLVPRGVAGGLGALPNTVLNPRAWQTDPKARPIYTPWGMFKPAFTQATMQSWQGLMVNSRATYMVDTVRLANAWRTWTDNMLFWGTNRYGEEKRRWILGLLMSTASLGTAASQTVHGAGYSHVLPWTPRRGEGINSEATIGDFGIWAAERQLYRRQRKYLGTLTVAYVSEGDPAFASSQPLRKLLSERRKMLLNHPALNAVNLAQVVDADFRQAIATRQGPKGFTDAPGGGPAGPKALAGTVPQAAGGSPVGGPQYASAMPMLPGSSGVNPKAGAALLMLLGFLLK